MLRLPVSQFEVNLRPLAGNEELLLLEASGTETETAIRLLDAVCDLPAGAAHLPVPDLEFLLLQTRRATLGDVVQCDTYCPVCRGRVTLDFSLGDYLAHDKPAMAAGVLPADEPGWFLVQGTRFRVPTALDVIETSMDRVPLRALARRCVDADDAKSLRRAESAMARMAPALSRMLDACCPHCDSQVPVFFDVQSFVLRELRGHAMFLYSDIHSLATTYCWSEADILRLPQRRRAHYASMVGGERRMG